MTPKTDSLVSASGYAGGGFAVLAGLTLNEWGVIVGIVSVILTMLLNFVYHFRKDRREQRLFKLRLEQLQEDDLNGE